MSRTRIAIVAGLVAVVAAFAAIPAGAATSSSQSQVVTFRNQAAIRLTLNSTAAYDFGTVDPLATVSPAGNENIANVRSNAAWHLAVKGTGNFSDGAAATINDNVLAVTGTSTINLSGADQTIASSATGTSNAGVDTNINYALTLNWSDPIGAAAFTDTLTYTAYTP